MFRRFKNRRGQSLVEYLIIVALVAVGTLGIVRILGHTVSAQFARITYTLQGRPPKDIQMEQIRESHTKNKDLSDFFDGAAKQQQ